MHVGLSPFSNIFFIILFLAWLVFVNWLWTCLYLICPSPLSFSFMHEKRFRDESLKFSVLVLVIRSFQAFLINLLKHWKHEHWLSPLSRLLHVSKTMPGAVSQEKLNRRKNIEKWCVWRGLTGVRVDPPTSHTREPIHCASPVKGGEADHQYNNGCPHETPPQS